MCRFICCLVVYWHCLCVWILMSGSNFWLQCWEFADLVVVVVVIAITYQVEMVLVILEIIVRLVHQVWKEMKGSDFSPRWERENWNDCVFSSTCLDKEERRKKNVIFHVYCLIRLLDCAREEKWKEIDFIIFYQNNLHFIRIWVGFVFPLYFWWAIHLISLLMKFWTNLF